MGEKQSLTGYTLDELQHLMQEIGEQRYRAEQVYKWMYHLNARSFGEMTNLPQQFRDQLQDAYCLETLSLAQRQDSIDGTRKYLWRLPDNHHIESVYIPEEKRTTLCISSQVGCALGCDFCATAKMGFLRHLTVGEIVEQVLKIREDTGARVTNVVFMGMGEPFLNYDRVIKACQILNDPAGMAISAKKITISTVGIAPRIRQFAEEGQPYSLAISLHAADQAQRQKMMPVADRFDLDELMASAKYYTHKSRRRITFEYVLLEKFNDHSEDVEALIALLSSLKCKLNLIPYNETGSDYHLPSKRRQDEFVTEMQRAPFAVTLRKNRGNDIDAACGQLMVKNSGTGTARSMPKRT